MAEDVYKGKIPKRQAVLPIDNTREVTMSRPNFMSMLRSRWAEGKMVCVGLDTDLDKLPEAVVTGNCDDDMYKFNTAIIQATHDLVCAYKPNVAFYSYEDLDLVLQDTIAQCREVAPGVPVILDFKRGDIGNTNNGYVREAFEKFGADAVTVSPYFGGESLKPFLEHKDRGVIVLCRTSNPSAGEFQDELVVKTEKDLKELLLPGRNIQVLASLGGWKALDLSTWAIPLYQIVAAKVAKNWNGNGNVALVVGATAPMELRAVRYIVGEMPILAPGVGAQGGSLEEVLRNGATINPFGVPQSLIINSSRDVLYAYEKKENKPEGYQGEDFAELARQRVLAMNEQIRNFRPH